MGDVRSSSACELRLLLRNLVSLPRGEDEERLVSKCDCEGEMAAA